jgi:inorganic pyrophosphatase
MYAVGLGARKQVANPAERPRRGTPMSLYFPSDDLVDDVHGIYDFGHPTVVPALVEMTKGRSVRFVPHRRRSDRSPLYHLLKFDRHYNTRNTIGDYGCIPGTVSGDDGPLDIFVIVNEPTFEHCLIEARVIGYFELFENGLPDHKVIAVPMNDLRYKRYDDLEQDILHDFKEAALSCLRKFKLEKPNWSEIKAERWRGRDKAVRLIWQARMAYWQQRESMPKETNREAVMAQLEREMSSLPQT